MSHGELVQSPGKYSTPNLLSWKPRLHFCPYALQLSTHSQCLQAHGLYLPVLHGSGEEAVYSVVYTTSIIKNCIWDMTLLDMDPDYNFSFYVIFNYLNKE